MQLKQASRSKSWIKLCIQGPSGSGKTYSSILLAKGIANGDLNKVAVIDTENGSSNLYSNLGSYNVVHVKPPYSPEKYIDAISLCDDAGMEVIILDSISHCWNYLLAFHSKLPGNSFTNWNKVTQKQRAFIDKMLQTPIHFIATMRTKQHYVLQQKNGKYIPEKVGLKAVQRDGIEYEFTTVFDLDIKHFMTCSKDRTGLFMGKPEFQISVNTGRIIRKWCNEPMSENDVLKSIKECKSLQELLSLYKDHPPFQESLKKDFNKKKQEINHLLNLNNISQNGISISKTK